MTVRPVAALDFIERIEIERVATWRRRAGRYSCRIGNSDCRWISFCGKVFSSDRSTSASCQVDELDADFLADRPQGLLFGDKAELNGRLDQLRAVAVAVGDAAALLELARG